MTLYRDKLEQWMQTDKPYKNKDFRLNDLMQVLPMNRTYLSQFLSSMFGCNFYQYVVNYRLEEAKRLMRENPDMKLQDISDECGFSSPTVFGRTFAREAGCSPSEWQSKLDNK
jgi:AraC-like DNA-binding protein